MSEDKEETSRQEVPKALVAAKRPVRGHTVVVLDTHRSDRGLHLEPLVSRAVLAGEIHELILTDEPSAGPDATVNRIAYLGFLEIAQGGVIYVGDRLLWRRTGSAATDAGGTLIGRLAGFDMTHFPNHINLVVMTDDLHTGAERDLQLDDVLEFVKG